MPGIQKPRTTHLKTEVSRRCNPKGDVQQHRHASPRCVSDWRTMPQPSLEVGARMLTCVNMRHMIQLTWWNDCMNDLINRKCVTQFMCQNLSMWTQSSTFCINMMHHSQGRVVPTTGFPGCYSVPILLFTLYSQGFLSFLLLASPWSEAKGGECSDPHRPQGDHVCIYYI